MKRRKRLHEVVVVTLAWSFFAALVFCAIYGFGGSLIVGLITNIESVRETADVYLPWLALAPLVCVWPFLYDGRLHWHDALGRDAKQHAACDDCFFRNDSFQRRINGKSRIMVGNYDIHGDSGFGRWHTGMWSIERELENNF